MRIKTVTISSKGQVVLPREIRERLGVEQGDKLDIVVDDQGIHLRPSRDEENPFVKWIGALPQGEETTEEFIRHSRHEGLTDEELRILRSGPGAQVFRIGPDGEEERI